MKKIKTITLDENHIYRVDGKVLPSVSEVMKPLSDEYYGTALGSSDSNFISSRLEKRRLLGSAVHDAIETYILFGIYDPSVEPYMVQFKKWLKEEDIEIVKTEMKLTDNWYCGTIDLYCRERRTGRYVLTDIKVTAKINLPLVEVQLAAYKNLLDVNKYQVDATMSLHLREKGYTYKPVAINIWKWKELLENYEK